MAAYFKRIIMAGKSIPKTQENNIAKYAIICTAMAVTVAMFIVGPVKYEAVGLAYTVFSSAMGAMIGGLVGKYFDHTPEGIAAGAAFGAVLGVIMCAINDKKNEEAGTNKKDFFKAIDCTTKTILSKVPNAIGCGNFNPVDCAKTYGGFDEITECMGNGGNFHGADAA